MVSADSAPSGASADAEHSIQAELHDIDETTAVSWEGPTYARIRSIVVGGLVAVLLSVGILIAVSVFAVVLSGSLSVETLVVGGVLLLVGGPFSLLYLAVAFGESTDQEKQSARRFVWPFSDDRSWIRPGWSAVGIAGTLGGGWWLSGTTLSVGTLAPLMAGLAPLIIAFGRSSYRLDPSAGVLEQRWPYWETTSEQSLAWLVGVRRLRIGSVSLFVCSNRGKRWYEGVNLLVVPQPVDEQVDDILRQIATSDPPRRVKRDERILFGVIGASMIGVGPLLYLLSSEPALLFILAGPSTLIGLGVMLHALRG